MCCFNYIVKYYELKGYDIMVQNLQKGMYRYKCSTSGIQSNFSHFEISIELDGTKYIFEVQHNLANQSSHDENIFTTPDISIIVSGAVKTIVGYYDSKKRFSFVENKDICSFCEVKNFTPFPELIFNFVGVLNEIRKDIISNSFVRPSSPHIAPCLMISGKPNKQTSKIKSSLEARYCINIVYDLFYAGTEVFSIKHLNKLRMLST